ncbi:hypothetical protein [Phenylobacterium sp.]|uniref:hypothetical protein n=1 Tax=Phenylobacterium sp. TaxID=1871053 RepID=UPI003BAB1D07
MQAPKAGGGVRSLKGIVATAGAARVLNLHALAAEDRDDPEYNQRPLFIHPVLNRSIIMKYNVPSGEEDNLAPRRFNSTKIVFPFDQDDLDLGGQGLFVDQVDFPNVLARVLDYTDLPLGRDVRVLRTLDRLPTLDPFLVRETLKQLQIDVGRCYSRLNSADQTEMLAFVAGEVEALIRQCFGEVKSNDRRSRRLSQLLLAEQDNAELQPLRDIFRMDVSEFAEAMFSWKGFLYYRWRSRTLAPMLRSTLKSLLAVRAGRYGRIESAFVVSASEQVQQTITAAWREVGQRLRLYDQAFASLTDQENPDGFRSFLMRGSGLFMEIGARIGQMEQVVSFWNYCFSAERLAGMSPEEVLDGLRDLLQALSIGTGLGAQSGVEQLNGAIEKLPAPPAQPLRAARD